MSNLNQGLVLVNMHVKFHVRYRTVTSYGPTNGGQAAGYAA